MRLRSIQILSSGWRFCKTDVLPACFPEEWESVVLPHTWNAIDGQDGGNDYWRGTACYALILPKPDGERSFLEFNGAAMTAEVYLNGQKLARHAGGYSTFRVELPCDLPEENLLCVTVDNSANDRVYPQKADFTFYGGLYRDVKLITVPAAHFELVRDGMPGLRVTPQVSLLEQKVTVTLEAWAEGGQSVQFTVADQRITVPLQNGYAKGEIILPKAHLWQGVSDPYLYTAEAELLCDGAVTDEVSTRFGCRSYAFDAEKGFLLNGRSYPLRGVSRHQDRAGLGNALTIRQHVEDMELIREIGANTVRLAHYQHAQEFYDLCDAYGMIVWAEIPYITAHMPGGRENSLSQMRELVTQCYHHPSIICWGLSNEITAGSQVTEDLLENHRLLNDLCHQLDPTRPTVMAHAFMLEQESPVIQLADIGSYNLYFGWYLGELEQNDSFFDEYHKKYPQRIMGFSEYGADANPAYQSPKPERGDYSESYQCLYHEHILRCTQARPWLWSTYVWNMFDFAADGRDEGGLHGVNQKGLVTMDRSLRKDAFYLYKAAWNKQEPFVHLCGKRYRDRSEDVTEIKVFSNQKEITLFVDEKQFALQAGETVFRFQVPISGTHRIVAAAGPCRDSMEIRKVDQPNASYRLPGRQSIINWFDQDTTDPNYYSIADTLGTLSADPATAKLVADMMAKVRSKRGDVAQSTSKNTNLQKMLSGMQLRSLLRQAGEAVSETYAKELNSALQRIPRRAVHQQTGGDTLQQ